MADQHQAASQAGADPSDPLINTGVSATRLTRDHLQRLAGLVAGGEITPASAVRELSPEACQQLEAMVRELCRARLVRFIAMQIALDIHGERDHERREQEHRGVGDCRPTSEQTI